MKLKSVSDYIHFLGKAGKNNPKGIDYLAPFPLSRDKRATHSASALVSELYESSLKHFQVANAYVNV